jgi:hypothetical protein
MRNTSCTVLHAPGTCRHYSDTEVPAPERAKAVSVLDTMASERRAWLTKMREEMAELYRHRVITWGEENAYVTADDARMFLEWPDLGLPAGASPNLLGSLFRAPGWERSEHPDHASSTPGSHANNLYRWRYVGQQRSAA